jgi:hypothetical protein
MIVDINGNKYTSAAEDIDLERLRHGLKASLETALLDSMYTSECNLEMPLMLLDTAYSLGLVRDSRPRPPTRTESERFGVLKQKFVELLAQEIFRAGMSARDGCMRVALNELNELLAQAYYAGREDGGA